MRSHNSNGLGVTTGPDGQRWVYKQKYEIDRDEVIITLAVCDGSRGLAKAAEDATRLMISEVRGTELYGAAPRFSESRDLARVFADYAAALARAHGCGYVHRDLNYGNLLLTSKSTHGARGVLVDFGCAVPIDLECTVETSIALGVNRRNNRDAFSGRYPPEFVAACEDCYAIVPGDAGTTPFDYSKQRPELADPGIDVYGLGKMLGRALSESKVAACDPEGAAKLREVVDFCCAGAPENRPSAAEVRDRLDSLWQ